MNEINKITFKQETFDGDTVVLEFLADDMTTDEIFQKWVQFMNGMGYILDPIEMVNMWNGETLELAEKLDAYEILLQTMDEFIEQLKMYDIDHSNHPDLYKAKAMAIATMQDRLKSDNPDVFV